MLEQIKRIVAHNTLLACPHFHKEFKIHNDAINFQLGVVIRQEVKSIAFYSRKLTEPKMRYMVTEKELLIIVKNLK